MRLAQGSSGGCVSDCIDRKIHCVVRKQVVLQQEDGKEKHLEVVTEGTPRQNMCARVLLLKPSTCSGENKLR